MSRQLRSLFCSLLPAVLCVLSSGSSPFTVQAAASRPNFLIFVADDMAWNDCGAYGHQGIRTPNIDRLSLSGMRFDRAYLSCSSCSPSRSSILTGRYPHNTEAGELHMPLPKSQQLVTSFLRTAGYYTASAGKWHLGPHVRDQVDLIRDGGGPGGEGHWLSVLRERPRDKPFFFWFAATDPHRAYAKNAIKVPHSRDDVEVPSYFPDTPEVRDDLALYYDEIGRFDEFIGHVLQELDRQGATNDTMVLVISDNGRPFPRCKTRVHVDGVRTPFIVRYPAMVAPGSLSMSVTSSIDIAPTVLDLAGIELPESFQGKSFVPVLKDSQANVRQYAHAEHNWHDYRAFERAVHSQEYCYIRNWLPQLEGTPPADAVRSPTFVQMMDFRDAGKLSPAQMQVFRSPRPAEEFYDVVNDPECLVNLIDSPQHRRQIDQHRTELARWQTETDDHFPGADQLSPDRFDRISGKRLEPRNP